MARVAMIGATGLIGRQLAPQLVAKGDELVLVTRRASGIEGAEDKIAPMEGWPDLLDGERVDVAISTLGTTLATAGSWEQFVAVDETAVLTFAHAAKAAGASQFLFVSSVGANPNSRAPYLALKGRVEQQLRYLGFDRLDLVRPGLLRGERGRDRRLGERFGILVSPVIDRLLPRRFDRYRSIDAGTVATSMARLGNATELGQFVHENSDLIRLAN